MESGSDGADEARLLLAEQRAAALARLAAAEADFERIVSAGKAVATDDEHDPEGIGLALERAHVVASSDLARRHLAMIDEAEERLDRGEYGRCSVCRGLIPLARLQARPTAATCVGCAGSRARSSGQ